MSQATNILDELVQTVFLAKEDIALAENLDGAMGKEQKRKAADLLLSFKSRLDAQVALPIKELAAELGVSEHYVYQMRACGFPMVRRTLPGCGGKLFLTATEADAREWIEANNFHLTHDGGRGVTNGQLKFCLQVEKWTGFVAGVTNRQGQMAA